MRNGGDLALEETTRQAFCRTIFHPTYRRAGWRVSRRRCGRRAIWCRLSDLQPTASRLQISRTFLPSGRRAGLARETPCVPPSPPVRLVQVVNFQFHRRQGRERWNLVWRGAGLWVAELL